VTRDRRGLVLAIHLGVVVLLGVLQLLLPPFHHGMMARIMVLAAYATGYNVLLGYNTARYRLVAIVVSGVMSAVAGAAYTLLFSYVGSTFAGILYSIYPLLWTLLGGAGTTLGPLIGTLLMTYLVDVASGLTTGYLMVVGAVLVLTVLWAPAGLVGGLRARWARWLP